MQKADVGVVVGIGTPEIRDGWKNKRINVGKLTMSSWRLRTFQLCWLWP